jgi:hypothetical protein
MVDEANRLSDEAKKWTSISFWVGIAVALIYFIIGFASAF